MKAAGFQYVEEKDARGHLGGEHPNPLSSWVEYLGAGTETYIDWHNLLSEIGVVDHVDAVGGVAGDGDDVAHTLGM